MSEPDPNDPNWPLPSFDAVDWARAFNATARGLGYATMDEGWLIGWFANALMRGFDERDQRPHPRPKFIHTEMQQCRFELGAMYTGANKLVSSVRSLRTLSEREE